MDSNLLERYRWFRRHGVGGIVGQEALTCLNLARAEVEAEERGLVALQEYDPEPWDGDCPAPKHLFVVCVWREEQIERASACAKRGEIPLASLGSVGVDDECDPYLRIVAAELFREALSELRAEDEERWAREAASLAERATYAAGGAP